MSTLFELSAAELEIQASLERLEAEIEDAYGEVTPEQEAEYDRLLREQLETDSDLTNKLDAYGFVIIELGAEIEALKGREKPLRDLLKNLENRRKDKERRLKWRKEALKRYLEFRDIDKIECDHFRYRVQRNGGKTPIEVFVLPEELPEYLQRVTIQPDYDAIREALNNPDHPAHTKARFGERDTHLRIY